MTSNDQVKGPADAVYLGNVVTMDEKNPHAEAVAVKDGIILFVGSKADAKAFCDEKTEVVDYGGLTIYPGFLESHCHVGLAGVRLFGLAQLSPAAPLKKNLEELAAFIKENPGREFYVGSGWTFTGEDPTASMLDEVCSDVPVMLQTGDGHSVWLNSKALEIAAFTPEQIKEFGPAQIRVDENGKPTGYISETPAIELFRSLPFTVEDLKDFYLRWQEEALMAGFTGACDAGLELFEDRQIQAIYELEKEGKMKFRIYGLSFIQDNTETPEADMEKIVEKAKKYNSEHFKIIGAKVFIDGVIEAHTAWMLDGYKDQPGYHGVSRFDNTDLMSRLIIAADKHGMLVHSHSDGDAASKMFADSVEKAVKVTGNYDQRNAAAHLQFVKPEDIERFGKYGIVAVSGYQWCPKNTFSYPYEEQCVGAEYAEKGYPAQSFIKAGAVVVGHTDYPISPIVSNPHAFYEGVTRTSPFFGEPGVRGAEEAMSRWDTLASITKNVAYMWHEEDRMGTLEPGKLANMTVYAADFLNDTLGAIAGSAFLGTIATIVEGKIAYEVEVKLPFS